MLLARCCYIMSLLLVPALSESSGGAKSLQLEEQAHCEEACHPLTEYCDRFESACRPCQDLCAEGRDLARCRLDCQDYFYGTVLGRDLATRWDDDVKCV